VLILAVCHLGVLGAIKCSSPFPHFLPMLVYQGVASFELWTGREAPIDIMISKAEEMPREEKSEEESNCY